MIIICTVYVIILIELQYSAMNDSNKEPLRITNNVSVSDSPRATSVETDHILIAQLAHQLAVSRMRSSQRVQKKLAP